MTAGFATNTPGGSPHRSEVRVVVLGNDEVDVIKYTVGCGDLVIGELVGQCVLYEIEQAGRKISVVETQGSIKNSISRSVSLCPPGPHALLLVSPVNRDEEPSSHGVTVRKHTIVLFACDEGVGEFPIEACIQKAKKILEKCKGRAYILKRYSNRELLKKIEDLVEENCGDVFIPQTYYELWKTSVTEVKPDFVNESQALLMHYFKPMTVIALAVSGALLGAVAGAEYEFQELVLD